MPLPNNNNNADIWEKCVETVALIWIKINKMSQWITIFIYCFCVRSYSQIVVLALKTTGHQAGPELNKTARHLAASLNNQPASHVMNFSQD